MGRTEAMMTALGRFFSGFSIPAFPEDHVELGVPFPYLTFAPVFPKGFNETENFHARLWYSSDKSRRAVFQKSDEIRAALGDGLVIECEGGAILLCAGSPWAQSMDNPPERYLCEYLNFEITSFVA